MEIVEDYNKVINLMKNLDYADLKVNKMDNKDPDTFFKDFDIRFFIVKEDNLSLGFCGINKLNDVAQTPMFLFKAFRGNGFGKEMISCIEEECFKRGMSSCMHRIEKKNKRMIQLSKKCSYKEVGKDSEGYIVMMKRLGV